jgi:hypothetical protein
VDGPPGAAAGVEDRHDDRHTGKGGRCERIRNARGRATRVIREGDFAQSAPLGLRGQHLGLS